MKILQNKKFKFFFKVLVFYFNLNLIIDDLDYLEEPNQQLNAYIGTIEIVYEYSSTYYNMIGTCVEGRCSI